MLKYSRSIYRQRSILIYFLLLISLLFVFLFGGFNASDYSWSFVFQSPLPDDDSDSDSTPLPPSWIFSEGGGILEFGSIKVKFPHRFTDQGGANVFGDVLVEPLLIKNEKLIVGTEFVLGVYPPNVQTDFQQPIEIRVTIDTIQAVKGAENQLVIKMYDPSSEKWEELKTEFDENTFQLITTIQSFKPVPKEFPTWGWRTLFGVFQQTPSLPSNPIASSSPTSTKTPTPNMVATEVAVQKAAIATLTGEAQMTVTDTPQKSVPPTLTPPGTSIPILTATPTPNLIATEVAVQKAAIATLTGEAEAMVIDTPVPSQASENTSTRCFTPLAIVGMIFTVTPFALRRNEKTKTTRF